MLFYTQKKVSELFSGYKLWNQKLNNTGILAIHDIYDTEAEGGQAPKEIYEKAISEGFILIDRVKSLVALQRST